VRGEVAKRRSGEGDAVWWWSDGGGGAAGRGGGAAAAQVWRRAKRLEDGPIDLPLTGSFLSEARNYWVLTKVFSILPQKCSEGG
jgi:hypothetical protein